MRARLRRPAAGIIRQLEAGDGYREQIERELHARLARRQSTAVAPQPAVDAAAAHDEPRASEGVTCASCETVNESDARFCKSCGQKIA
jgi:hypothetical protein